MPSEHDETGPSTITGRCYCGASSFFSTQAVQTVAYCHCIDCKRWTGAPAPAFVAVPDSAFALTPMDISGVVTNPGVTRRNCPQCGSPLAARFDYLPGQTYVPLGLVDQADHLVPQIHCHFRSRLPWVPVDDTLPKAHGTARAALIAKSHTQNSSTQT